MPNSVGSYVGMTLMELMAIIIIIGILAAIALPNFVFMREHALDEEAIATLQIIQTAEKIFAMDNGYYYPSTGIDTNIITINNNLKISLPTSNPNWNYTCDSVGCADATRNSGANARTWRLRITDTSPTSNAVCP